MGLVAIKCKECGATLSVEKKNGTRYVCPYCGANYEMHNDTIYYQAVFNTTKIVNGKQQEEDDDVLARGDKYLRIGKIDEAIACYKEATRLNPTNIYAYHRLFSIYKINGIQAVVESGDVKSGMAFVDEYISTMELLNSDEHILGEIAEYKALLKQIGQTKRSVVLAQEEIERVEQELYLNKEVYPNLAKEHQKEIKGYNRKKARRALRIIIFLIMVLGGIGALIFGIIGFAMYFLNGNGYVVSENSIFAHDVFLYIVCAVAGFFATVFGFIRFPFYRIEKPKSFDDEHEDEQVIKQRLSNAENELQGAKLQFDDMINGICRTYGYKKEYFCGTSSDVCEE